MAGMAVADAVLAHDPSWQVTLVGREPDAPYNRVLLSQALAGDVDDERLALRRPDGVALRLGAAVARARHPRARRSSSPTARRLDYDALVLATGSAPWLPPVHGPRARARVPLDRRHARDPRRRGRRAHARWSSAAGCSGWRPRAGCASCGVDVTVVHLADRLMELQLDPLAARLLERRIRALGIDVLCGRRTEAVTDDGVALADGAVLPADLVVFATGIRPEVALARDAGLEVGRGVLVDDNLRASAPGVWAVGECAEHRGTVYGLWAPVLEQARAAGAAIAGPPRGLPRRGPGDDAEGRRHRPLLRGPRGRDRRRAPTR